MKLFLNTCTHIYTHAHNLTFWFDFCIFFIFHTQTKIFYFSRTLLHPFDVLLPVCLVFSLPKLPYIKRGLIFFHQNECYSLSTKQPRTPLSPTLCQCLSASLAPLSSTFKKPDGPVLLLFSRPGARAEDTGPRSV